MKFFPIHSHFSLYPIFIWARVVYLDLGNFDHILAYHFSMSVLGLVVPFLYAFCVSLSMCIMSGSPDIFSRCPNTSIFAHGLILIKEVAVENCYASSPRLTFEN